MNYPDNIFGEIRKKPLLMLHLLWMEQKEGQHRKPLLDVGVVAWGINFPESKYKDNTVEYVVNTTWWREHYGRDVDEEDQTGDDVD